MTSREVVAAETYLGAPTRATARKELGGGAVPPFPDPPPSETLASSLRFAAADTVMEDRASRCSPEPARHANRIRKKVPTCRSRRGAGGWRGSRRGGIRRGTAGDKTGRLTVTSLFQRSNKFITTSEGVKCVWFRCGEKRIGRESYRGPRPRH